MFTALAVRSFVCAATQKKLLHTCAPFIIGILGIIFIENRRTHKRDHCHLSLLCCRFPRCAHELLNLTPTQTRKRIRDCVSLVVFKHFIVPFIRDFVSIDCYIHRHILPIIERNHASSAFNDKIKMRIDLYIFNYIQ